MSSKQGFLQEDDRKLGSTYVQYMFQLSFASTATTIISGAVAERIKLNAYILLAMLHTLLYSISAFWVWNEHGFLARLGFFDFSGSCVVHISGGASALAAAWLLGPRSGRFAQTQQPMLSSPVTTLTGTLLIWWAVLGFNSGSTMGIAGQSVTAPTHWH